MTKKSWTEKLHMDASTVVKRTEKKFADIPPESLMLISTPAEVDAYLRLVPEGKDVDIKTLRNDLALEHQAEYACPVTTGIFLRIVAEANFEKLQQGTQVEELTPFWRAVGVKSNLRKKLSFGTDFVDEMRKKEGLPTP